MLIPTPRKSLFPDRDASASARYEIDCSARTQVIYNSMNICVVHIHFSSHLTVARAIPVLRNKLPNYFKQFGLSLC